MIRYCTAALLGAVLLLPQCGGHAAEPAAEQADATVFPPGPLPAPYQPPADGDFVPRYIAHLLDGGRDAQHYAQDRLAAAGPAAAPAVAAALAPLLADEQRFAYVVNLCQALGRCGDPAAAELLVRVLREYPVPVARSAAAEALGALRAEAAAPAVADLLRQETEIAVRERLIGALGKLGGAEAGAALERLVAAALGENAPADAVREGNLAWLALIQVRDAGALARLQAFSEQVGPLLRLQALIARQELGETGLLPAIAEYLDADRFPSAKVRALALEELAAAGDWGGVLAAAGDADAQLRLVVARSLADPGAPEVEALAALSGLARDPDVDVMRAALASLVQRGDRRELEPWLRSLREFPLGAGSTDALNLLADPKLADPRSSAVLVQRWRFCDPVQKVDAARALAALADPPAAEHLGQVLADSAEPLAVRVAAGVGLANFGAAGVPPLLALLPQANASPALVQAVVPSLARLAQEHSAAAAALAALPGDAAAGDYARKLAIELLPKALHERAVPELLRARDLETRSEVRGAIDAVLTELF